MRAIRKILEYFEFPFMDTFNQWRDDISVINTDKEINGELVFSIHPIDFMTMSDNNDMIGAVKNVETSDYLQDNYITLQIRRLGYYGRKQIVDKWLLIEDSNQDVNSLEFVCKLTKI